MKKRRVKTEKKINISGIDVLLTKKTNMKRLYVKIKPPYGDVVISAPTSMSDSEIEEFFISKLDFINRSILDIKNKHKKSIKEYVDGEIHYLWGKPYTLNVLNGKKGVKVEDSSIIVYVSDEEPESVKNALNEFYRYELKKCLKDVLNEAERLTGVCCDEVRVRNMRTNWGSCNIPKKRVWVSLNLAKYPRVCLLYILVHELTHLKERNHNKRFYQLLDEAFDKREECDFILKEIL